MSLPANLNKLAQIMLGTISPGAGRLFSPSVQIDADQQTASTNTVWILLPETFFGVNLRQRTDIAIGLLAHELGHWLQPHEADQLAEMLKLDPWTYNLVLDVQDEATIATAFPPILGPLQACRKLVTDQLPLDAYIEAAETVTTFLDAFRLQAMLCRFLSPGQDCYGPAIRELAFPLLPSEANYHVRECARYLRRFVTIESGDLPKEIAKLAKKYPELCADEPKQPEQDQQPQPAAKGGPSQSGDGEGEDQSSPDAGEDDQSADADESEGTGAGEGENANTGEGADAGEGDGDETPSESDGECSNDSEGSASGGGLETAPADLTSDPYACVESGGERLDDLKALLKKAEISPNLLAASESANADAECRVTRRKSQVNLTVKRMAQRLEIRFKNPKGSMAIQAPDRLDLHAAIRQDPCPFRMDMPSRLSGRPLPKVVLALDHSGSMKYEKWNVAHAAAQAITLAVQAVGGDVRVLVFDTRSWHLPDYGPSILEADELIRDDGRKLLDNPSWNTGFSWLPEVWAAYPDHLVIMLTDGEGYPPAYVSKADRSRTSAVVIPDGSPNQAAIVAERVVVIQDINALPGVFSSLIPRQWVA